MQVSDAAALGINCDISQLGYFAKLQWAHSNPNKQYVKLLEHFHLKAQPDHTFETISLKGPEISPL